ncbi:MAG TPA: hypothetical protein VGR02_13750 [Thermoanaerobaculia bacterium]|jgi:hypothetical protein|nr:hypothetical protein [Thermoanaerobaculia bacterium]
MSSKATALDVDFERDLPTTQADSDALWRARQLAPLSPEAYQKWTELFAQEASWRRHNVPEDEPFTL